MVRGIEVFRDRLAAFRDSFIVIGGTACDLNLQSYGGFRRTRDIDMIVVTEAVDAAFADALHAFLREGGYECYVSRDRKPHYYRFMSPKDPAFPAQIEMLSHTLLPEHPERPFTPISLDEGIRSLSAIVLDPDYYEYAKAHRDFSWGVPCLTVEALVVFKCAAYLNLRADRERDPASVRSEDLNKHRNDVFRLLGSLPEESRFDLPEPIRRRTAEFAALFAADSEEWDAIRAAVGALALEPRTYAERLTAFYGL